MVELVFEGKVGLLLIQGRHFEEDFAGRLPIFENQS